MRGFVRYDVALGAALAAAFFALFELSMFAAWLAAAPLIPLLRHVARLTVPVLWLPVALLISMAGLGYVLAVQALAMHEITLALLDTTCALVTVSGVCYTINVQLGSERTPESRNGANHK